MRSFQFRVWDWVRRCFGDIKNNREERCWRFFEEATELVQAGGMTRDECLQLITYVYDRPAGDLSQEVGGTLTTLAALCNTFNIEMELCGETELKRINDRIYEIRRKNANKPRNSPLPGVADEDG